MKYLLTTTGIILIMLVRTAFGVTPSPIPDVPEQATNIYNATVYCAYNIYPDGNTCYLGYTLANGVPVTDFSSNGGNGCHSLMFTLEGEDYDYQGATYTVTTNMQRKIFGGKAEVTCHWVVTDYNGTTTYGDNDELSLSDVKLKKESGDNTCEAKATFEVICTELVAQSNCPPAVASFNMTVTATLNI